MFVVLIKRQIVQTWCFISQRNLSKFQHFVLLFSATKQSVGNGFGVLLSSEMSMLAASLKI